MTNVIETHGTDPHVGCMSPHASRLAALPRIQSPALRTGVRVERPTACGFAESRTQENPRPLPLIPETPISPPARAPAPLAQGCPCAGGISTAGSDGSATVRMAFAARRESGALNRTGAEASADGRAHATGGTSNAGREASPRGVNRAHLIEETSRPSPSRRMATPSPAVTVTPPTPATTWMRPARVGRRRPSPSPTRWLRVRPSRSEMVSTSWPTSPLALTSSMWPRRLPRRQGGAAIAEIARISKTAMKRASERGHDGVAAIAQIAETLFASRAREFDPHGIPS